MCDFFWQRLETADQGDLADVVRASRGGGGRSSGLAASAAPSSSNAGGDPPTTGTDSWQHQQQQHLHSDHTATAAAAAAAAAAPFPPLPVDGFFGSLGDPLLHELAGTGGFFEGSTGGASHGCGGDVVMLAANDDGIETKRPCSNLFSRVLQISPSNKPTQLSLGAAAKPPPPIAAADRSMQIPSPRGPGIKRRKSQAKKVVCIPAPAAASNRPSGEVVPSDLWAWRKYGQKPIKGSPYPRGYYRCSSSKGCSARKQVERSRTDPNMLVITYTSEHNHPWPTQRNALAGSTRSQPTKSGGASSSKTSSGSQNQRKPNSNIKEEPKEYTTVTTTSSSMARMKEEEEAGGAVPLLDDQTFDQIFYSEPATDHGSCQPNDFFADLAELDPDPMSLIFSRTDSGGQEEEEKRKELDSFIDIFDWGGSSFGDHQAKKGL